MKLPVSLKSIFKNVRQMRKELAQEVKIVVVGESLFYLQDLITALAPSSEARRVFFAFECKDTELPRGFVNTCLRSDAILVAIKKSRLFARDTTFLASFVSQLGKPFLLVLDGIYGLADKQATLDQLRKVFNITSDKVVFISARRGSGLGELAEKIILQCDGKEVALGSRMPLLRLAAANKVIKRISMENGLIGLVTFLPGSDMPVLTANQMKMLLKIAAIYNQKIDASRVRELAIVLGGGFTFRAVYRQLLNFMPGLGWLLKGAVACSGTLALGKATIKYFENGFNYLTIQDLKQILSSDD